MNIPENKKNQSVTEDLVITSYKVLKARVTRDCKVVFDLLVNGITIYGCFVNQNKDGVDFISLPQTHADSGKWYSIVYARFSDKDTAGILSDVERLINE